MARAAYRAALVFAGATVLLLGALHLLSPEFAPSWRMVSEYANGEYQWVLTAMFFAWGAASLALAGALRQRLQTRGGKIGWWLLIVAGICQILAGIFAINHPLHDVVGNIGIPSFAIAAVLISRSLRQRVGLSYAAAACVVLLVVSFVILMTTYVQSGGNLDAGNKITALPDGVIAVVGYANRLLIVVYALWAGAIAYSALHLKSK